jgi:hypothetical protein
MPDAIKDQVAVDLNDAPIPSDALFPWAVLVNVQQASSKYDIMFTMN